MSVALTSDLFIKTSRERLDIAACIPYCIGHIEATACSRPLRRISEVARSCASAYRSRSLSVSTLPPRMRILPSTMTVSAHAPRTIDCQHLNRRLGAKHLRIEPSFMQSAHDEKRLADCVQIIARHRRIRPERQGKTELQHFWRLAVADVAHGLVHGRAGRERNLHIPLLQHVEFFCIHPSHVEQQHIWPKQSELFEPSDIAHAVLQM